MNIGIDARMYGPQQTGIGNYIKYLIEELARLDKKNTYYIFLCKEEYSRYEIRDTRYHKILADFSWYSLAEQTLFLQTIVKQPLDLMHFPHFNVPLLYRKPFIVTIHDITPKFFPGEKIGSSTPIRFGTRWLRRKAYDAVLSHAATASRAIITPSQCTKNDILKYFAVSPEKISVIYEGIPKPAPSVKRLAFSHTKNYKLKTKNYLLYVGVWRSHKNLLGLLRAFAILKKEGLPHSLVLAGPSGQYFDEVKKIWQNHGLARWIVAPGFLSAEKLSLFYQNAACVVFPSFYEGFGLVPLEALQAGVPVAVSDIPSLREILGESAFFFDPRNPQNMAETIRKTLFDKPTQQQKMNAAKKILLRYSWENNAKRTLEIYEQAADRKRMLNF